MIGFYNEKLKYLVLVLLENDNFSGQTVIYFINLCSKQYSVNIFNYAVINKIGGFLGARNIPNDVKYITSPNEIKHEKNGEGRTYGGDMRRQFKIKWREEGFLNIYINENHDLS